MPNKRKDLKIVGPNLWYLVGLITSDGCLSSDGRNVDITSKDYKFLQKIKDNFNLSNKIGTKNRHKINEAYYLPISNINFYEFLLSIGLTPHKSLKLNNPNIPKDFFVDFLRGVIDGDGSLRRWIHPANLREQWSLRIYSGSRLFIMWLRTTIEKYLQCQGRIYSAMRPERRNFIYTLKYGKMAARVILEKCYYGGSLGLDRKIKLAKECLDSYKGWSKSKTVYCGLA